MVHVVAVSALVLVVGLFFLIMAGAVWRYAPRNVSSTAMSVYLFMSGLAHMSGFYWNHDVALQYGLWQVATVAGLVAAASAAVFWAWYPAPRRWSPAIATAITAPAAILMVAFLVAPRLFVDEFTLSPAGDLFSGALGSWGPVFLLSRLVPAGIAVAIAVRYARMRESPLASGMGVMALALAFPSLVNSWDWAAFLATTAEPAVINGGAWWVAINTARLLMATTAAIVVVTHLWRGSGAQRRQAVVWAGIATASVVAGTANGLNNGLGLTSILFNDSAQLVSSLVSGTLLAVAMLRHGVMDLHVHTQVAVSRGMRAAVSLVGFFVISEISASLLSDAIGPLAGIVGAGAILLALVPLQGRLDRASATLVGSVVPREGGSLGKQRMYRLAVQVALADGRLSAAEERSLNRLAAQLGLDSAAALRILEREEGMAGVG